MSINVRHSVINHLRKYTSYGARKFRVWCCLSFMKKRAEKRPEGTGVSKSHQGCCHGESMSFSQGPQIHLPLEWPLCVYVCAFLHLELYMQEICLLGVVTDK
jgi:hypothetical protein